MKIKPSILVLSLWVLFAGAAAAQTPDGDPPSGETICDDWSHDQQAFGLCNAYCEAMDCDSPDHRASERACERKYQQFEMLTGNPPPCEGITCPCVDEEYPIFSSFADPDPITGAVITGCTFDLGTMIMTVNSAADNAEVLILEGEEPVCSSTDPGLQIPMMITEQQAIECLALLTAAVEADLGSTDACGSFLIGSSPP